MNKKITLTLTALLLTTTSISPYSPGVKTGLILGYGLTRIVDGGCDQKKAIDVFRKDKDKLCKFLAQKISNNCQSDECKKLIKLLNEAQLSPLQKIEDIINENTPEIVKDGIQAAQEALTSDNNKKD